MSNYHQIPTLDTSLQPPTEMERLDTYSYDQTNFNGYEQSDYYQGPTLGAHTHRPTEMERLHSNENNYSDSDGHKPKPGLNEISPRPSHSSETRLYNYSSDIDTHGLSSEPRYREYKRRWIGLAQMSLMIFIIEWDGSTFANISTEVAEYFGVTVDAINYLSPVSSASFIAVCPLVIWVLNKSGPKQAIVVASILALVGNWVSYIGTRTKSYPVLVIGQILLSMGGPFVLAAPTRFSRMWFGDRGRTTATAIASLTNPLGAAVGGIVSAIIAESMGISNLVLITSIISSVACVPALFIPKAPPSPPSAVAAAPRVNVKEGLKLLVRNRPFYLQAISFSIYVAAFDATATLVASILLPYGFNEETTPAIAATLSIVVGIVVAAILSPIMDRTKSHLLAVKVFVPLIASSYVALIFIPESRSTAGVYTVFSLLGAASFAIMPGTLEFQAEWTHPVSPELSSTICWAGGEIMSAIFVVVMDALKLQEPWAGQPKGSLFRGLIFQAVLVWAVVPCAELTGIWIFKKPPGTFGAE